MNTWPSTATKRSDRRTPARPWAFLLAALLLAAAQAPAEAQTLRHGRLKFGGYYRPSGWVEYEVTVSNNRADFQGRLEVRGSGRTVYGAVVSVPSPFLGTFTVPVLVHAFVPPLTLCLVAADGRVAAELPLPAPRPLAPGDRLVACALSEEEALHLDPERYLGDRDVRATRLSPADLPVDPKGYHHFDALLLGSPGRIDPRSLGALRRWIRGGGSLVLARTGGLHEPSQAGFVRRLLPAYPASGTDDPPALLRRWGRYDHLSVALEALGGSPEQAWFLEDGSLLYARLPLGEGWITLLGVDPASGPARAFSFEKKRRIWERVLLDLPASGEASPAGRGMDCVDPRAYDPFPPPRWTEGAFERTLLHAAVFAAAAAALCALLLLYAVRPVVFLAAGLLLCLAGTFYVRRAALPEHHASVQTLVTASCAPDEPLWRLEKTVHVGSVRGGAVDLAPREPAALRPVAYDLHLLKATEMRLLAQGSKTVVEGLRLPPRVRFCFRVQEVRDDLGRVSFSLQRSGGELQALVANETAAPLAEAHVVRMGRAFALGRLEPGDVRRVSLSPGRGLPLSTLLYRLGERGCGDERRILSAFVEDRVRPGETVFTAFAPSLAPLHVDSPGLLENRALPTLVFARPR